MEKIMLSPYTRRSRCEVPTCKCYAAYQVCTRINRPMLLLCEEHAMGLYSAASTAMQRVLKAEKAAEEASNKVIEPEKEVVEPADDAVETPAPKAENAPKKRAKKAETKEEVVEDGDFYICKHCGEKFPKGDMTPAQFAQHCRKCKKGHTDAVSGD